MRLSTSILMIVAAALPAAAAILGDASRGAEIFKEQKCVTCHSVRGEGGKTAPDLGRRGARAWTPSTFASVVWNHAPAMWSAMDKAGIAKPSINEQQAADLFAHFFAARAFDPMGDAGRGRKFFEDKGCAGCHNISTTSAGGGTAVIRWESVADVIELARQMWNHAPQMQKAAAKANKKLQPMTVAEMNDIIVYLTTLPQVRNVKPVFSPASFETGQTLFNAKGCTNCHTGEKIAAAGKGGRSTAELAVSMWNHAAQMKQPQELRPEEMRRIAGYLWALQFEKGSPEWGSPARGEKLMAAKGCNTCHGSGTAPALKGHADSAYMVVAAVWGHGPAMKKAMEGRGTAWPRFTSAEMADLIAAVQ